MCGPTPTERSNRSPRKRITLYSRVDEHDDRLHAAQHPTQVLPPEAAEPLQAALSSFFPGNGPVLDLMSGAHCYIPRNQTVIGVDVDETALIHNAALTARLLCDLNVSPVLPFGDAIFVGAVCVSGIQYLTSPIAVFREIHRTLRPGAPFIVAYTDLFFPAKAIAAWSALHTFQRSALVSSYFRKSGGWAGIATETFNGVIHLVSGQKTIGL